MQQPITQKFNSEDGVRYMVKVIIAEDQSLLVDLLRMSLSNDPGIDVIACTGDGVSVIEMSKDLTPDVILMDIDMPGQDGIEATKVIKSQNPNIKSLILTVDDEEASFRRALEAGADGYVLKSIETDELISAIKCVHGNMKVYCRSLDAYEHVNATPPKIDLDSGMVVNTDDRMVHLDQRDVQLLKMIVEGQDVEKMAAVLEVSPGTIRNQTTMLINKLNVKDKTQLAVLALQRKLIE